MRKKEYAPELTKEYLQKLGIEEVDPAGRFIIKNGKPVPMYSNGMKREYLKVKLYDPEIRKNTPKEEKKPNTGRLNLAVHVINYAWQHDIKPAGYVVDHINNDPLDNRIENLQLLTPAENIRKDRKPSDRQLKCKLNVPLVYYENKLSDYLEELFEIEEVYHGKPDATLRANIANTKARIRYWLAHQEEAEALFAEKLKQEAAKKAHSERYHEVAKMKRFVKEKANYLGYGQDKLVKKFIRLYDDRDYNILKELYNALGGK